MRVCFYNTLTHRTEDFEPIEPGRVAMYNCGPTVYDFAHIGNFRAFVFADVLRRFLELVGYHVDQVMNITDVGHMTQDATADGAGQDKMSLAADRILVAKKAGRVPPDAVSDPTDPYQVARYFTEAFIEDARGLNLKVAGEYPGHMPVATGHIREMIDLIEALLRRGHAYVAGDGAVYYDVQSFPDYGRLSGNSLDQLRGGAGGRVLSQDQAHKRHPADFLLWKPDPAHLMKWDSPWGSGYPGWHIECSAMAMACLNRPTIDIHTGGEDNIFPHHECEIAQSTGATGEPFARFWMHTRYLLVDGQKMSKSRGNFYTVRDVLEGRVTGRPVDPAVLRLELLRTHYRSNMNFSAGALEDAARAVRKLRDLAERLGHEAGPLATDAGVDLSHPVLAGFAGALADDLNVSRALAVVFSWLATGPGATSEAVAVIRAIDRVLGVIEPGVIEPAERCKPDRQAVGSLSPATDAGPAPADTAEQRCAQIDDARRVKDFVLADRLRQQLVDAGYEVRTTPRGTTARRQLA